MAIIDHLNCESGTIQKISDEIDVKWEYIDGSAPVSESINEQTLKKADQISSTLSLKEFTFPPGSEHNLKITSISKQNSKVFTSITWKINVDVSPLLTII